MTEPVKLHDTNAKPDPYIVEVAERILERAKSGELRELVAYGTLTGNHFYSDGRFLDGVALIGALECIKYETMGKMLASKS
jgi:hypothetical protein